MNKWCWLFGHNWEYDDWYPDLWCEHCGVLLTTAELTEPKNYPQLINRTQWFFEDIENFKEKIRNIFRVMWELIQYATEAINKNS